MDTVLAESTPTATTPTSGPHLRTRWAAIGAALAVAVGAVTSGGIGRVSADVSSGDRPVFVPVEPCRLTDTRDGSNNVGPRSTALTAGETLAITAHGANGKCTGTGAIPADALALSLNVTALAASELTFLTFWGDGDNPGTANLNPAPGQPPTPNAVNTPLSSAGTFNIFNATGMVDVVIDVNGYYAHHDHDDRYYTKAEVDAGQPTSVMVGPVDFVAESAATNWRLSAAHVHDASTNEECVYAPVNLPAGSTVTSIATYFNTGGPADVTTGFGGTLVDAQPLATIDAFVHTVAVNMTTSLVASPPGEFEEIQAVIGSDAVVRDNFAYIASVCTKDPFSLAGVEVSFSR